MVVDLVVNDGGTTTVTATLRDTSDTDIDSLSTTVSTISSGDYCGFGSGFDQLGSISHAWVDNIHVQASGSTNYVPTQIATSYVHLRERPRPDVRAGAGKRHHPAA